MRIQIFPPLAFLAIVVMLFAALKPGLERAQAWRAVVHAVPETGLVVEGERLKAIVVSERASIQLAGPVETPYAVIGSTGSVTDADINGVHYFVPPDVVRLLRGQEIDIKFEVRAAPGGGSDEWMARAAIAGAMDSGWTRLTAAEEWTEGTLRVSVPPGNRYEPMVVMIWSDAKGDGRSLELRKIRVIPVGPSAGTA
jgi:hypothetical protein